MRKFSFAATVALAAAQNVLPDFEAENPHRQLSHETIDNETDCLALNPTNSTWYTYGWNSDRCICQHEWLRSKAWNMPGPGEVNNPFYVARSGANIFITQDAYDNEPQYNACPELTCTDILGNDRGFASAFLQTSGSTIGLN